MIFCMKYCYLCASIFRYGNCGRGETGRHTRLRIWRFTAWGFESLRPHLEKILMASVYILHSKKLDKFYIGSCKELLSRLEQHLEKLFSDGFTAKSSDWELFFRVDDLGYGQARKIETHIKRMKSKEYIFNLNKYPQMIAKLKNKYPS